VEFGRVGGGVNFMASRYVELKLTDWSIWVLGFRVKGLLLEKSGGIFFGNFF